MASRAEAGRQGQEKKRLWGPGPGRMLGLRAWAHRAARRGGPGGSGGERGVCGRPPPRGGERAPAPAGALGVLAAAAGPPGALREAARRAAAVARAAAGELRSHGGGAGAPGGARGAVAALDGLSCVLCQCVDALYLVQSAHARPRAAAEAATAFEDLQGLIHELNVDRGLHAAVDTAVGSLEACHAGTGAGGEVVRLGRSFLRDFERSGAHLPAGGAARVGGLEARILRAGAQFQANLAAEEALGGVDLSAGELAGLPEPVRRQVVRGGGPGAGGGATLPGTPAAVSAALKWAPEDGVRRRVQQLAGSTPEANGALLREILEARAELAAVLGATSFAHLVLGGPGEALAETPEAAKAFLEDLLLRVRPRAEAEARELLRLKSRLRLPGGDPGALRPWDRVLLTSHAKAEACGVDAVAVSEYLSLENAFQGLGLVLERLTGIEMVEEEVPPGAAWAPGLRAFALQHPEEGRLGLVLMDLLPRPGKYPHSAHFTLRSGRRLPDGAYQLPIAALVCSFRGSKGSSRQSPLLLPSELDTLFHEFGHALHSVLSRAEFQHLSGTRGPKDFVEVPAKIFERYASCAAVLPLFAKHCHTGAALPQAEAHALQRASTVFSGLDLQQQALISLMDLRYAGSNPPEIGDGDLFREHGSLEVPQGWERRFSHFVDYGGMYYSYLYARCLAAEFWRKHCSGDPLGPAAGRALRRLLNQGCAGDSIALLREVLGPDAVAKRGGGWAPSPEACIAALGD